MIISIGEWAVGFLGALVSAIAFFGPTAVLTFVVARLWKQLEKWGARTSIQEGLAPVSIGLLLAGRFTVARGAITGLETATIAVGVLLILLQYKINPALLVLGSAIVGVFSFAPKYPEAASRRSDNRFSASQFPADARPTAPILANAVHAYWIRFGQGWSVKAGNSLLNYKQGVLASGTPSAPHTGHAVDSSSSALQGSSHPRIRHANRTMEVRMENRSVALIVTAFTALFCWCLLVSCKNRSLSSDIKCGQSCSFYQQSDPLPDQPSLGIIRLGVGGDSRNDESHVLPWAFKEATRRGAKAFFFLGDLEITQAIDKRFLPQLAELGDIPFYPAMGNHEVETLGLIRGRNSESLEKVKKFKEEFLTGSGVHLAPFSDTVVYSVDLDGGIHFILLDNVSRKGEGFGPGQLVWLAEDLSAANAEKKIILVGMHKALAKNPVTKHAMDEDGPRAVEDSDAALELLKHYKASMVFVSHSHMYAAYPQDGVQVRLTGGMGAPLVRGLPEADGGFHHFLLVDVSSSDGQTAVHVQVVKFPCMPPCAPTKSETDESQEID